MVRPPLGLCRVRDRLVVTELKDTFPLARRSSVRAKTAVKLIYKHKVLRRSEGKALMHAEGGEFASGSWEGRPPRGPVLLGGTTSARSGTLGRDDLRAVRYSWEG